MGDRGGGRESKGSSLKKSKKNPGAAAARVKTAPKAVGGGLQYSAQPPAIASTAPFFDCGAALLSRQFDRDRERVIVRAKEEGQCCGLLLWFSDIEKQTVVADLCKANEGFCYFATGIHPDNIDRTNKKSHGEWVLRIEELAKRPECVAILSGMSDSIVFLSG
jgi:hypothetical protein